MNIWRPSPVTVSPVTNLASWRAFLVKKTRISNGKTIHFVGSVADKWGDEGRVSSAIQSFDNVEKCGISRSGRKYVLLENPGHSRDGLYVWECWKELNFVVECEDITDRLFEFDFSSLSGEVHDSPN